MKSSIAKRVLGKELGNLKRELEKKFELQQKLRQALTDEVDDPDEYLFEIPDAVNISSILKILEDNSKSLNENCRKSKENSTLMKDKFENNSRNLRAQVEKNSRSMKDQIKELYCRSQRTN